MGGSGKYIEGGHSNPQRQMPVLCHMRTLVYNVWRHGPNWVWMWAKTKNQRGYQEKEKKEVLGKEVGAKGHTWHETGRDQSESWDGVERNKRWVGRSRVSWGTSHLTMSQCHLKIPHTNFKKLVYLEAIPSIVVSQQWRRLKWTTCRTI